MMNDNMELATMMTTSTTTQSPATSQSSSNNPNALDNNNGMIRSTASSNTRDSSGSFEYCTTPTTIQSNTGVQQQYLSGTGSANSHSPLSTDLEQGSISKSNSNSNNGNSTKVMKTTQYGVPQQKIQQQIVTSSSSHSNANNAIQMDNDEHDQHDDDEENLMVPLVNNSTSLSLEDSSSTTTPPPTNCGSVRSRKKAFFDDQSTSSSTATPKPNKNISQNTPHNHDTDNTNTSGSNNRNVTYYHKLQQERLKQCCTHVSELQRNILRNTITAMNFLARILFWVSLFALAGAVVWYSRELSLHGTDPHLIAWFSAGAFVILGFPISIYGILMHLTNYYQPNVQCYVVRILWMVPIYSIESWLCLRFHEFAIYIETLRDCYESFVLYCFLQFLIEVLGGEEALILLLKDKSPTRGFHYAPMNWCLKPWIMGQPVSNSSPGKEIRSSSIGNEGGRGGGVAMAGGVLWKSPFFVQCKFGCLQYVLLKFVSSIFVMVLEVYGLYKEGDFTTRGGYLYICILTNLSQCWALYCMIIFYYATKNELGPIRPVGKFLSVKALVFFTWWQSVGISILFQMDLIPNYNQDGWTAEDVAKGIQAYLICIEMFIGAIVHTFVFPHTDYLKPMIVGKNPALTVPFNAGRRLGRRGRHLGGPWRDDRSKGSKTSSASPENFDFENQFELTEEKGRQGQNAAPASLSVGLLAGSNSRSDEYLTIVEGDGSSEGEVADQATTSTTSSTGVEKQERTGFTSALFDSIVPRDVMDNTVAIARGDFKVEKKTLLYHAAASDEYSLFKKRKALKVRKKQGEDTSPSKQFQPR